MFAENCYILCRGIQSFIDTIIRHVAKIFIGGGQDNGGTKGPKRGAKCQSAEGVG